MIFCVGVDARRSGGDVSNHHDSLISLVDVDGECLASLQAECRRYARSRASSRMTRGRHSETVVCREMMIEGRRQEALEWH